MSTGGTLVEVDAQIDALRAAQRDHQTELQNAEQLAVDALAAEQASRDALTTANRLIDENRKAIRIYADEIDILLEERKALIPQQAGPVD